MATQDSQDTSFLQRARQFFLILGGIYVFLVALGTTPFVQRNLLYMHNLRIPPFAQYDMPEKYDLAPFKTHNVRIHTADNETLGAWFTFSDPFYTANKASLLASPSSSPDPSSPFPTTDADTYIRNALRTHPTVLFLHGNGGTRALRSRVQHYQAFASRLRANVLAPDYRGFADSTGTPSEAGLSLDTLAAWDWLRAHGAAPENVLVVGNSLGTGVAVQFASALQEMQKQERGGEPQRPRGVVLLAPFSSIETLLDTYYIMGLVPLLAPLRIFPFVSSESFLTRYSSRFAVSCLGPDKDFVKRFLVHRFDSLSKIVSLKVPLLIVHAEDDWDIPHVHSETLFDAFLEPHLPTLPEFTAAMAGASEEVAERMAALAQERAALRTELVAVRDMARVGRVEVFARNAAHGEVVFLRTRWGGHDRIGLVEGVQDYMAEMFRLG
ncbi:Alpha/Beta hydrolase protein [Lactarius vividus]|nr:Alpha/Beta hydrolase protein [Lactarius vividus]